MHKIIGFLLWIGCLIGGLVAYGSIATTYFPAPAIILSIVGAVLLLISGIGRRVRYISDELIKNRGLAYAVRSRIFCKRFYASIFFNIGLSVVAYGILHMFSHDDNLLGAVIALAIGGFIMIRATVTRRLTCSHCGARLIYDDSEYDNLRTIELDEHGGKITQYSTEYYHCSRCGYQTSMRINNTVGQIKYK